ncbi:MAG TPA: hypothetical protein PLR93_03500 [Anaerolineales bacterium]|nr:hypothetical protein [Anaerolineales bacterium]HNF95071.1 hypothetical protein [Anaerolineales bacterium]HNH26055.1 hypothetical protein [Anaerolineales bacterium]
MKHRIFQKRFTWACVAFLLIGCSPATTIVPESTATPYSTFTPIDTPTNTLTPTPYPSATIVKIPTWDPNQPTFTPFAQFSNIFPTGTSSKPGPGFASVTYSPTKIYWGGCTPNSVTIIAKVDDVEEVTSVLIFVRVKDLTEEDYTPWTNGDVMLNRGQGEFTTVLYGSKIKGHDHYLRSWVYFQLVATNIEGEEIGRTKIYDKAFDMYPCPCLTPLTGCPIATPKPPSPTPKK